MEESCGKLKKRRLSESFVSKLTQKMSSEKGYEMIQFAKNNFLVETIVHLALEARGQIHSSKQIILLERKCDFQSALWQKEKIMKIDPQIYFVIYWDPLFKGYFVSSVKSKKYNQYKKLFLKKFRGKSQQELE